jgi:hypothetical protein
MRAGPDVCKLFSTIVSSFSGIPNRRSVSFSPNASRSDTLLSSTAADVINSLHLRVRMINHTMAVIADTNTACGWSRHSIMRGARLLSWESPTGAPRGVLWRRFEHPIEGPVLTSAPQAQRPVRICEISARTLSAWAHIPIQLIGPFDASTPKEIPRASQPVVDVVLMREERRELFHDHRRRPRQTRRRGF